MNIFLTAVLLQSSISKPKNHDLFYLSIHVASDSNWNLLSCSIIMCFTLITTKWKTNSLMSKQLDSDQIRFSLVCEHAIYADLTAASWEFLLPWAPPFDKHASSELKVGVCRLLALFIKLALFVRCCGSSKT